MDTISGGKTEMIFRQWREEGVEPSDMFQRINDLFDSDPKGAEEYFGEEYMDVIDYFTHYWA